MLLYDNVRSPSDSYIQYCRAFFSPFCNEFDKFVNTGARTLDAIYHMPLKIKFETAYLSCKAQDVAIYTYIRRCYDCHLNCY